MFSWNFHHTIAFLLPLLASLVNLGLFIKVFFFTQRKSLHVLFSLFVITLFAWQLGDVLVRISGDAGTASFWLFCLGNLLYPMLALWFHFSILFTRRFRWAMSPVVLTIIYLPAFVFLCLGAAGMSQFQLTNHPFWGYLPRILPTPFNQVSSYWVIMVAVFTMVALFVFIFRHRKRDDDHRMQAILISVGFAVPAIQGILTELLFPLVFDMDPVPLTSTTISIFSICAYIAIKRHRMFSFSPKGALPFILQHITEGVMITDHAGVVQYVNHTFCDLFGWQNADMVKGQPVKFVFDNCGNAAHAKERMQRWMRLEDERIELEMHVQDVQGIVSGWTQWSRSAYKDNKGRAIGYIFMVKNISMQKLQEKERLLSVIETEEKERVRLGQDLHDGVCQNLSAAKMMAELMAFKPNEFNEPMLTRLVTVLRDTLSEVRTLSHGMTPQILEETGLSGALRRLCEMVTDTHKVRLHVSMQNSGFSPTVELSLYRISQELIQNTLKHARATAIQIDVTTDHKGLWFEYRDNGQGFEANGKSLADALNGMGICSIHSRVRALDGSLNWHSALNRGVEVRIHIPREALRA